MKIVAQNRRARHEFEIIDTVEAGIMLHGHEVKSARMGNMDLSGSYVSLHTGKPVLKGASIAKYANASNLDGYETHRDRELLLKKRETEKLVIQLQEKGATLIPMEVKAGKYIKVTLGLGRGRKKYDKRQRIKEKDVSRRIRKGEEV